MIGKNELAHFINEGRILIEIAEKANLEGGSPAARGRVRAYAWMLRKAIYGFVAVLAPFQKDKD